MNSFQDLLAKYVAQLDGELGQRGVVPNREASRMHITNVVRGSFGFTFEEINNQPALVDTSLSLAIDQLADFLEAFKDDDEDEFASKLESVDQRVLVATKQFFDSMKRRKATMRLVAGDHDSQFGEMAIDKASNRADTSTIEETEESLTGTFLAALPASHRFEIKLPDGEILGGSIDRSITSEQISAYNKNLINQRVRASGNWKRISRNDSVIRQSFTLKAIEADG